MNKKKFWGQNQENKMIFDLKDFHNPKELWNKKIPEWREKQKKSNTLSNLKKKGWPFQWAASWELNKFQEPMAEEISEHIEVINWYYKILIKENKNKLEIGNLKLEIKELKSPKKVLISITTPMGNFNPLENYHNKKTEKIDLIYKEKPSKNRLLGDIILSPFRKKIDSEKWETESIHTPWDLLK